MRSLCWLILSVGLINLSVHIIPTDERACAMLPYVNSDIFSSDSKYCFVDGVNDSRRKTYHPFAKVVTFEGTPKVLGNEIMKKNCCRERKLRTRTKAFPVGVDNMDRCSFSIRFFCSISFPRTLGVPSKVTILANGWYVFLRELLTPSTKQYLELPEKCHC